MSDPSQPTARVRCPHCSSRLDVQETVSGGRNVSVAGFGPFIGEEPKAVERFVSPDSGPDIICPACQRKVDPAGSYPRSQPRRF